MHFLHFGIIETTQRSRCLRHMRVSKVYPGNPVGIMHVWCLMGQVLGFTPLHLPLCLRQWRQGRPDGANAFVTQENHESVCAWRATVSILGNGFTCTCPCQDLKFWRFEVSLLLKTIMLRPFFGVFWHMCSCCTVCQQFYSEKFSGCLGCVPILKMQSLHMWSKAIPSIVVHRCTFTVTLASASDLICVFLVCTNALFVFAYYEETHSMYLHSMNTQCICILSAHAAPYRGIWHQHRVCSSLAKTSQNNEKPWQLWRRGERGCSLYCNLDEGHARHSAIAEALDSQL